jgi:drug/metabolite transporter (DMT)-like permease
MLSKRSPLEWSLLAALVVLFGSSFLLIKMVTTTLPPMTAVMLRLWLASLVMLPLALFLGHRIPPLRAPSGAITTDWHYFFWLALIGNAGPFVFIFWGMKDIDSSMGGILMSVSPIATMIIAHLTLHDERMTGKAIAGLGLAFIGILILFGPQALASIQGAGSSLWAQVSVFIGAILYAINNVIARKSPLHPPVLVAACVLPLAAICMTPLAILVDGPTWDLPRPSAQSMWALLTLSLATTALATTLFMKLVTLSGPTFLSLSNYMVPLFAIAIGMIFAGESPSSNALLALVFVLAGIFLSQAKSKAKS